MNIIAPQRGIKLTGEDQTPTLQLSEWLEIVTARLNDLQPLSGTGSPEGSVIGKPGQTYIDVAGAPGSTQYVKLTGIGDTGWSL